MASALSQAKTLAKYNNKLEQSNVALQYSYNKSLAEQDRSWQERMANSAHQREIADLKAAGLNPVLSVTGGNGAVTPSGSSASVSKPSVDMSLPSKVMDMAIAQLNSATALQTTAMNNANALQVVYDQGINALNQIEYTGLQTRKNIRFQGTQDRKTKKVSSGDSWYGQINSAERNELRGVTENYKKWLNYRLDKIRGRSSNVNEFEDFYNSSGYYSNKNSARKNERINRRLERKERRQARRDRRTLRRYERRYK